MGAQRALRIVVVFALVGGVSYCTWGYLSAGERVGTLCREITPGMTLAQLDGFATGHGLGPRSRDSGVIYLMEGRTFGRHGCRVTMERGVVRDSAYHFAD